MFWWSIDTITYPWTKHWSKCYPGDWWQTMHLHIRPRGRLFQRFGVAHMICSVPAGLYNAQSLFSRPYAKSCKFPKHPLYQVLKQYIPWICNNLKLLISEIFLTPSVQVEKNTLLLMADILHQLMLVVYPIIYKVLAPSKRWFFFENFWSINVVTSSRHLRRRNWRSPISRPQLDSKVDSSAPRLVGDKKSGMDLINVWPLLMEKVGLQPGWWLNQPLWKICSSNWVLSLSPAPLIHVPVAGRREAGRKHIQLEPDSIPSSTNFKRAHHRAGTLEISFIFPKIVGVKITNI